MTGLAKMHNTRKARAITAGPRDMFGGHGILLDYQVMRHMVDMEVIHTFEGTETMPTLIAGRAITGLGPHPGQTWADRSTEEPSQWLAGNASSTSWRFSPTALPRLSSALRIRYWTGFLCSISRSAVVL